MTTIDNAWLDERERLAAATTPAPWTNDEESSPLDHEGCEVWPWATKANMDFAYDARTSMPLLITEVRKQDAEIARLQSTIDEKADLPHSCSDSCMRPACVLRRENREQAKEIERLRSVVEQAQELRVVIGIMFGVGRDCILPESVHTPIGVPMKLREIGAAFDAALAAGAPPCP